MAMIDEFRKFALRGNVVDMTVGITVGAAFATIAKSLVDDVIMPPIGLLIGNVDFADFFVVLKHGTPTGPYPTLEAATTAGAVTLRFGTFFNNVFAFLVMAFAIFQLVRLVNRLHPTTPAAPTNRPCPYCTLTVSLQATRCPHCTSQL